MGEPTHLGLEELLAHTRWVEALARQLVSDPARAEDLAQSTLLVALHGDSASVERARPWLARVLRNLVREDGRREAQRRDVERRAARSERLPSADELLARADAERKLVQSVLELDPRHAGILLLHYFEGVSLDDIARLENVAPSTVSHRLARAQAELRGKLERERGVDWLAASLPLLVRPPSMSPGATKVLLMSALTKTATGIAVVGLAMAVWFGTREKPRASGVSANAPKEAALEASEVDATGRAAEPSRTERANVAESTPAPSAQESSATGVSIPATKPATAKTGRIFGRVLNARGEPAVGRAVRVMLTPRGGMHHLKADAQGRFEQRELAAGKYHVSTMPEAAEWKALGLESQDGGVEWMSQASVVLEAGAEAEIELGSAPRDPIRVHGRLTSGASAVDALLQWVPERDDGYNRARYASSHGGAYEIVLGERGRQRLSVMLRGGAVRYDEIVDVPAGADWTHDIAVPQGECRVRVVEKGGEPLNGATVDLVPRAGIAPFPFMSASGNSRKTDEQGRTSFRPLRAGVWSVNAYVTRAKSKPPLAARGIVVTIAEGDAADEQVIELEPGIELEGRVAADDGGGLYFTNVFVFDEHGEPLNPLNGATTDKQGSFRLPGLGAGRYSLIGANGNRWTDALSVELRSEAAPIEVELRLRKGCSLLVDGSALAQCSIDIRDDGGRALAGLLDRNLYTGGFGRACRTSSWSFYLPRGNYEVRAASVERRLASAHVALIEGESRECKLAP